MKRPWRAPIAVALAVVALTAAWVGTNPPGFAPDEPAHYVKALGAGHGELLGQPARYRRLPVVDSQMLAWLNRTSRSVEVPAGLPSCREFRLPVYGRCPEGAPPPTPGREISYVATYPPFAYLLDGMVMRLGTTSGTALLLGRSVTAAVSLGLLAVALATLWWRRRHMMALVGFLLAVSPMVLFLASELSASGPEIAAGVCFAAVLLRLASEPDAPRRLWAAGLASGVVLAASRSTGPLWIAVDALWFVALIGSARARSVLGRGGAWAGATVGAIAAAVVAVGWWELAVEPHAPIGVGTIVGGALSLAANFPRVVGECVGVFGWIDVPMPPLAYALWLVALACAVGAAVRWGAPPERRSLLACALCLVASTGLIAVIIRATGEGFKMQGRYVLPVVVALPLLAGEIAWRHRERLSPAVVRRVVPVIVAMVAIVQGWGLLSNARYYWVNDQGRLDFIRPARWSPPGGWLPWVVVTVAGLVLLVTSPLALRERGREAGGARGNAD